MFRRFQRIYLSRKLGEPIIVVSGLPRSGTSVMMSMLAAGGVELLEDQVREPDVDNPEGYHEFELTKQLQKEPDKSWLASAQGKAVKVISELLKELPDSYYYKIIFMDRDLREVVASQNKMLRRREQDPVISPDDQVVEVFERHLRLTRRWLQNRPNFEVLEVVYGSVVNDAGSAVARVNAFLGGELRVDGMSDVVDSSLYRNRAGRNR